MMYEGAECQPEEAERKKKEIGAWKKETYTSKRLRGIETEVKHWCTKDKVKDKIKKDNG